MFSRERDPDHPPPDVLLLHVSVLPDHARWARVLSQLRFVVIDEVTMR